MKAYAKLHHDAPARELYVFHTDREQLDIQECHWLGIRWTSWRFTCNRVCHFFKCR